MTAAQTFYLVIAALIVVLVGVEVLDYLADAPLREQVERCVENGGGNFCDGLVTE